ncbi:MAG: hypothetical protein K2Y18_02605 [Alphaproteobacteria bacterium]|jgi:hypothetical protein|nr:hypothetical protein [Alphaproteobacteria bacterium]
MKRLLFCLMICSAQASDLCLMLSSTEEEAIKTALEQAQNRGQIKGATQVRLDGIIYTNPTSWTIWLNGRVLKAGETSSIFRILKVTPNSVELIWSPKPDQHHQVCLKINEAFQIATSTP